MKCTLLINFITLGPEQQRQSPLLGACARASVPAHCQGFCSRALGTIPDDGQFLLMSFRQGVRISRSSICSLSYWNYCFSRARFLIAFPLSACGPEFASGSKSPLASAINRHCLQAIHNAFPNVAFHSGRHMLRLRLPSCSLLLPSRFPLASRKTKRAGARASASA